MTSREVVINKALSGAEVKDLLRRDFERLLANEGLLSEYISYGKVAWDLRLRLHMTNQSNPESDSVLASKLIANNVVELDPKLSAVEAPPLALAANESSIVSASELTHTVDSPNLERVVAGMPVPVVVKQADGTTSEQKVSYPPPDPATHEHPTVTIFDQSEQARVDWKVPMSVPAVPSPADSIKA